AGGNLADVLIQTTVPFDSHTFGGWAIDEPCTSFYVGRIGQLVVPWGESGPEDLHLGFVANHEMMHYAFNAPDLYGPFEIGDPRSSGCWDLSWDGSVMHNDGGWNGRRWELTELDRNPDLTPCDHSFSDSYSWEALRERYIQVPERPNGPIEHIIDTQARGNEDGGALDIKILDRFGPVSSLKTFTPDDTNPPPLPEVPVADCNNNGGPILIDPAGDSGANLAPPEATLDIIDGSLKWDASAAAMTFEIGLGSVEDRNPGTAPEIAFNFNFTHGEEQLYVEGYRGLSGEKRFVVGAFLGTPAVNPRIHLADVTGEFNAAKDEVNIVLPNSVLGAIDSKPFESGDRITEMNIVSRRAANTSLATYGPTADTTEGACDFVVGTGTSPMPPPLDVRLSEPNLIYQWQGSRSTNIEREPLLGEEVFGCAGFDGPGCEEKRIYVSAPGLLDVSIEGENPDVNDFDLYLYDAEGKEIDSSENSGGIEAVSATVTSPGIYTVSVHAWLTIDAAYIGLAELTPLVPRSDVIRPRPSSPSSSSQPNPQKANRKEPALRPKVAPAPAPVESGPSIKAPPDDVRQVAAPVQVPTKGVSTTTGATAAAAALLVGLALGFTLARRRESR
ncbi:MAG: PPC domain-containing protein, partial [Actinomycetota bacterium]